MKMGRTGADWSLAYSTVGGRRESGMSRGGPEGHDGEKSPTNKQVHCLYSARKRGRHGRAEEEEETKIGQGRREKAVHDDGGN